MTACQPERRSRLLELVRGPVPVIAFLALLVTAWVITNPVGYTPDEDAHYLKALGVGHGEFVGRPGKYQIGPGFGPAQLAWINQAARAVRVPPGMAPDNDGCALFQESRSNACEYDRPAPPKEAVDRLTYVGTYEPFLYVPAGLATRLGRDSTSGIRLARTGSAGVATILLCLAALLAWRPDRPVSALGFLVAVTPTALFLASGVAPNGIEIAAMICFVAGGLRLRTGPRAGWTWAATAAGGTVLVLARSTGPYLFVFALGALVLSEPRAAGRLLRNRAAVPLGAVIAACLAANLIWNTLVQPHPALSLHQVLVWVKPAIKELPRVGWEAIAAFGWQDVQVPDAIHWAWAGLELLLLAVGVVVGNGWRRLCLVTMAVGFLVGDIILSALAHFGGGFPMYGRYTLALASVIPLCAAEAAATRRVVRPGAERMVCAAAISVIAISHAVGWYANARRYAVGANGPILFVGRAEWQPPLGWAAWLVVVIFATSLLVAWAVAVIASPTTAAVFASEVPDQSGCSPIPALQRRAGRSRSSQPQATEATRPAAPTGSRPGTATAREARPRNGGH